jgi:outer membrane protein assembly factor BamB
MRKWLFLYAAVSFIAPRHSDAADWPQYRGPLRDGVWRETGIVETLPASLRYRWKVPIEGGFAGPAVAEGRVYVTDRELAQGQAAGENRWDIRDPVRGGERLICIDEATGRIIWVKRWPSQYAISYPVGPRATPTVHRGKVYVLGAMGDLFCLDAKTGDVFWSKNYVRDFGTEMNPWGMACAPLVDGDRLIIVPGGRNGAGVVALNLETGAEIWRSVEAPDPGYSAPVIVEAGGTRQLLVWLPNGLFSLDPATGKVFWSQPAKVNMGHTIVSPIFDSQRNLVFVSSFFDGPLMMRTAADSPKANVLWQGESHSELPDKTEGLHCLMSTPVFQDGLLFGICSYGKLRCLDAETGKRLWDTLQPTGEDRWSTAFLTRQQDRYFLFNEHGQLIIAKLSREGYREISRAQVIEPTMQAGRRKIVWSYPAFANRCMFARNDQEIVCVDLSAEPQSSDEKTATPGK